MSSINDCKSIFEVEQFLKCSGIEVSFSKPFLDKDIMFKWMPTTEEGQECGLFGRIKISAPSTPSTDIKEKLKSFGINCITHFANDYMTVIISGMKCPDFCFQILNEKFKHMLEVNCFNDKSAMEGICFYAQDKAYHSTVKLLLLQIIDNKHCNQTYKKEIVDLRSLLYC